MSKILKKIICIIGIALLVIVIILNLFYTSELSAYEEITINMNNVIYLIRSASSWIYYL